MPTVGVERRTQGRAQALDVNGKDVVAPPARVPARLARRARPVLPQRAFGVGDIGA
jgi:hypothetical protein